jgi:hypothetical protein
MDIILCVLFLVFILTVLAIFLCGYELWDRWDYSRNKAYYEHKYDENLRQHYQEIEPFVIDTIKRHVATKKKKDDNA